MVKVEWDRPTREGSSGPRLLLVDDDRLVLRTLARMLVRHGVEVVTAASAQEARDQWAKGPSFEVVVTDLMMPGESGLSLAETLRRENPLIPIVIMTGGAPGFLLEAAHAGGFAVLAKPFAPDQLLRTIRGALDPRAPLAPPA